MAVEVVKVAVVNVAVPPTAVDNVLVQVYDAVGVVLITQAYSGIPNPGWAEFNLGGAVAGTAYTIRMSAVGMAFDGSAGDESKSPQKILVFSPPAGSPTGTNDFQVAGDVFALSPAVDIRRCRCQGWFVNADGSPYRQMPLTVVNRWQPTIVDGRAVLGSKVVADADDQGFISVDLYRGGEYEIRVGGMDLVSRQTVVPDRNSANLVDLLFPVVVSVVYTPAGVMLAVDDTAEVQAVVTTSDYQTLAGVAADDVVYTVADDAIAHVQPGEGVLTITGLTAGSTTLSAARADTSTSVIADVGIAQTPLTIVITP